ncbi:hypothetical protein NECHADRAFT_97479 [Paecilomyces variotii No. 5]|uniref:VWFA domain-containing protein n=1 Tax=Byssochlamys spectabilis (strain No. 5 / NBRC 109023) TaxID=1356009 RepID=V5G569_BYSSN|nr:hypothetical protein NECHADRAFT_97479 [Paecilomyces variotii No. 5]
MANQSGKSVIGFLIDVSGSMCKPLEPGEGDNRAPERLQAVISEALEIAQKECHHNPNTLMFVGAFGARYSRTVDLCSLVNRFITTEHDGDTGRSLLIDLANKHNQGHIAEYIQTKFTDADALILYLHLRQDPDSMVEFINAIPRPDQVRDFQDRTRAYRANFRWAAGPFGGLADSVSDFCEDTAIENSNAIRLASRFNTKWWEGVSGFVERPVAEVVDLLKRLKEKTPTKDTNGSEKPGVHVLPDTLRQYIYGDTPMKHALQQSQEVFQAHPDACQRVLILVSDGMSTDGDPCHLAMELRRANVTMATIYLTDNQSVPRRRLYDREEGSWNKGQRTLFNIASRVATTTHPIPVLASVGWKRPSSGECALYTNVCSVAALNEFCELLLSAHFGSADALLDVLGRLQLDSYIDNEHIRTRQHPSDQGRELTCYAHATAAVIHMALLRIVGRHEGYPSIDNIRKWIEDEFKPNKYGHNVREVLEKAREKYRPLTYREVNEDEARQAVLDRRPVLTAFKLSEDGWEKFAKHFENDDTRGKVLTCAEMAPHRGGNCGGGHAVVMVSCDPHSLTFLNSWGHNWGNNGSFSVENRTVLEPNPPAARVRFYDVYWLERDLSDQEKAAYNEECDKRLNTIRSRYSSIFELEASCPCCRATPSISEFRGSIREAECPCCHQKFKPEPGYLLQAIYARARLGEAGS